MASLTAQTHSHLGIGMRKKTEWTKGGRSWGKTELAIIFVKFQMCWYHVTFYPDVDHTQDACLPGDHRAQVWSRSSHLPVREAINAKCLRTDRQTTDAARLY